MKCKLENCVRESLWSGLSDIFEEKKNRGKIFNMVIKINLLVFNFKLKFYELYKYELLVWSEIIEFVKEKKGIVIVFILFEEDEIKIWEKVFE